MLPWRLGGKRLGFGAMAMGAVRGTALGVDMAQVIGGKTRSRICPSSRPENDWGRASSRGCNLTDCSFAPQ